MHKERYDMDQRRLRANAHIRELSATVTLSSKDFIQPLFLDEGIAIQTPIPTLSGINSDTVASAILQIEQDLEKGISKFLLFPVPKEKRAKDFNFDFITDAVKKIKSVFGDSIWLALDVCLCAYTSHGHCGVLNTTGTKVLNHESVEILAGYALQLATAGADCIAPSDLMDGRIQAIRKTLNENSFYHVAIMSYSAKFSSAYYGPFRDACKSTPGNTNVLKDRKTYQLSPFNVNDALRNALRDLDQGADILMVKPALLNLDILYQLHGMVQTPLAAYHVSGEYQGIELLAAQGLIQGDKGHTEAWISLKRAGANCIISYASRYAREWIDKIEY